MKQISVLLVFILGACSSIDTVNTTSQVNTDIVTLIPDIQYKLQILDDLSSEKEINYVEEKPLVFSDVSFGPNDFYLNNWFGCGLTFSKHEAKPVLQVSGFREEWIPINGKPKRFYILKSVEF